MDFIKSAQWRYATKKFDATRKVSPEQIELLKRGVQLAPSSYGLQPYKVLIIEDAALKIQLRSASWDQPQITDCSHLFVFCHYLDFPTELIDEYINFVSKIQEIEEDSLAVYSRLMKGDIAAKSTNERNCWARNQTYIALSNLLMCCAQEQIDSCPMEGFSSAMYNSILGLRGDGLNACVVAAVGYRDSNDPTQRWIKVRKPLEQLIEQI